MSLYLPRFAQDVVGFNYECRNDAGVDAGATDIPDAGAGGGDEPPTDTPATDDPADAQRADAASDAADRDTDDEDGITDEELADLRHDPRVKRILNRNRKLSRRVAESRPVIEQLRAFGVTDLRDVVRKAQDFDRVAPLLRQQHDSRTSQRSSRGADQAAEEFTPPPFDPGEHPFDPNDAGTKWILNQAKRGHDQFYTLVAAVQSLSRDIAGLRQGRESDQETQLKGKWRSTLTEASAKLPEQTADGIPVRQIFSDAVIGAFHQIRLRWPDLTPTQRAQLTPDKVVAHYLKNFRQQAKVAASAAGKQRIAEHVRALPGRSAFTGGAPSEVRDRKNERVKDVSRRLLGGRRW